MTDLLHIVNEGVVRSGDHHINIRSDGEGRLEYQIQLATGATLASTQPFDYFQDALMHALANLLHRLEADHPGENDDSVEGPGMEKEIAHNLLTRLCENNDRDLNDVLAWAREAPTARITTLADLHDQLGRMLEQGHDPNAPVRIRTLPREPNLLTGPETTAELDTAWYHPDQRAVYLDEAGV